MQKLIGHSNHINNFDIIYATFTVIKYYIIRYFTEFLEKLEIFYKSMIQQHTASIFFSCINIRVLHLPSVMVFANMVVLSAFYKPNRDEHD